MISPGSPLVTEPLSLSNLHRDQFGFQKLLVGVTYGGKVFALDSSNGDIVWSRNLGLFNTDGPELHVEGIWAVRDHSQGGPVVAVLATKDGDVSDVGLPFLTTRPSVSTSMR